MIAKQWEARIVEGQNCRLQKEVILILLALWLMAIQNKIYVRQSSDFQVDGF